MEGDGGDVPAALDLVEDGLRVRGAVAVGGHGGLQEQKSKMRFHKYESWWVFFSLLFCDLMRQELKLGRRRKPKRILQGISCRISQASH